MKMLKLFLSKQMKSLNYLLLIFDYFIQKSHLSKGCGVPCLLLAIIVSFSMALISHFCAILPMEERVIGVC